MIPLKVINPIIKAVILKYSLILSSYLQMLIENQYFIEIKNGHYTLILNENAADETTNENFTLKAKTIISPIRCDKFR